MPGRLTPVGSWSCLSDLQTHLALPQLGQFVQHLIGTGARDLSVTTCEVRDGLQML